VGFKRRRAASRRSGGGRRQGRFRFFLKAHIEELRIGFIVYKEMKKYEECRARQR